MDQTSASEKALQRKKYEEIVDLLLGAGYFRARIASLSEFDKVVGGLCWCITWSGEDVDSDLLFRENSTIGQKIALAEAIVKALRKMKCPATIQPHQIQGGVGGADYPAILPVIVWLIKKFFELKVERDMQLRKYSMLQFSRNLNVSNEGDISSKDLQAIASRKKVVRAFRRIQKKNETEEVKVRSCLIEYGETFGSGGAGAGKEGDAAGGGFSATGEGGASSTIVVNTSEGKGKGGATFNVVLPDSDAALAAAKASAGRGGGDLSAFEEKFAHALREASKEEQLLSIEASKQEAALLKQMQQISADEDDVVISGAQIGNIVGLSSSSIGSAAAAYEAAMEEARKQLDNSLGGGKLGQAAAFKRQQNALQTSIDERKIEVAALQGKTATSSQKLNLLLQERDDAAKYIEQLKAQIAKLESIEANHAQRNELATLKNLVAMNESLKSQEVAFKASCKAQLADLNARIKAMEESSAVGANATEEEKKFAEVEEMHSKVLEKYNHIRQLLAESNLEVANITRLMDEVPSRTELIQYERRFSELYQQVAFKLTENRKYFGLYNTLDTTLSVLQKEIKVLNSITDNFSMAMKSKENKAMFLQQFESIVRGVEDTAGKQESNLNQKIARVDELKAKHQNLIEEQRRYLKAVKDFQEECNKNEWLLDKLEQLKRK